MNILVIGVNFRQTPLEIREKLKFEAEEHKQAICRFSGLEGVDECVLLSTCNRTEVYVFSNNPHLDSSIVEKALCELKGLNLYEMKKHFYIFSSAKAVRHLFKVASGLDSMVLGEDQILRQVKDSYDIALEAGISGSVLNTMFRDGITVAKRVKTYTELSKNSVSVGTHAVRLVQNVFEGRLDNKSALIIGAGKIGHIALKNLISGGIGRIFVTNRTLARAQDISNEYENVEVVDYLQRYSAINQCDVVISSTNSPHYTVTRDLLEKAVSLEKERVFIDLAVPRDIDVDIKTIPWVRYFNIDDLQMEVDRNIDRRLLEVSKAEEIINEYVTSFEKWYDFRGVLPVVKDVQKFAESILNEKTSSVISRLKCASEEDKEIVRISMENAVNEILNKLIYSVRDSGSKEDIQAYFKCLSYVIKEN